MILHELRKTRSMLEKEDLLYTMSEPFDKIMFEYAYNPMKMYNVKFSNIDWTSVRQIQGEDIVVLDKLLDKTVSGNSARLMVELHCKEFGDLVKLICNKDLDCGISAKSLNKAFGKSFIKVFEVQLAKEVPIKEVQVPVVAQIKYNGVRVIALCYKTGIVEFRTRNGKSFEFPALATRLKQLTKVCSYDFILDGEITIGDSKGTDHTDVSGVINSAIKGTPVKNDKFVYNCFDFMRMDDFVKQKCTEVYTIRWGRLNELLNTLEPHNKQYVMPAVTYELESTEAIQFMFDKTLSAGYEGLILKSWSHKYTFKRSKDWIKVKAIQTVDLECVDVEEGTGKYNGMLGALVCKGIVEGKRVTVKVGSGLTDADRAKNAFDYTGSIIEVKYNTVIQDKTDGSWSLFLPRFVCVRGDL